MSNEMGAGCWQESKQREYGESLSTAQVKAGMGCREGIPHHHPLFIFELLGCCVEAFPKESLI